MTTTYVTRERQAVLLVSHEVDEEGGVVWQFHCGNGDYRPEVLQLVRLDEILALDEGLAHLADLPLGCSASRAARSGPWTVEGPAVQ